MECLVVFFVVFAIAVAASGALIRRGAATRRRRQSYLRLAKRFAGRSQPEGLLRRPAVLMRHGNTTASLREISPRGPYKSAATQIQINFPNAGVHFELFPRRDAGLIAQRRNLEETSCGNERFQKSMILWSDHRVDVTPFFTDGVCWQVQQLLDLTKPGLYIRVRRGSLLIQKPLILRDFESLERYVATSFGLYDQLMLTRAEGIEFLTDGELATLDQPTCTICGDAIVADMVYCPRCKTPHHGECWHYVGACATFACGEKDYLRPQAGTPRTGEHPA